MIDNGYKSYIFSACKLEIFFKSEIHNSIIMKNNIRKPMEASSFREMKTYNIAPIIT